MTSQCSQKDSKESPTNMQPRLHNEEKDEKPPRLAKFHSVASEETKGDRSKPIKQTVLMKAVQ